MEYNILTNFKYVDVSLKKLEKVKLHKKAQPLKFDSIWLI